MKISIVIPVYNEEELIKNCLDSLINQDYPKEDYEIIVVNDGSTDGTLLATQAQQKKADEKGASMSIVNLEMNRGRAITRETGAKNARYENLLFIDSRCIADKNILKKLAEINYEPIVGNPVIDFNRSVFDRFNWLMRKKLYRNSFGENFEPVYIMADNFDKVAKGTTVFFCDRQLFLSSRLELNDKTASDDTRLLWNIVKKKKILKHPDIKVVYRARTTFKDTIKHTFNRGPKFVDYYLNPAKKYFWLFIFAPLLFLSFAVISIAIRPFYGLFWLGFIAVALVGSAVRLSENFKDFFISILLLPLFGISFEAGIIVGLLLKFKNLIQTKKRIAVFLFILAIASGLFWSHPMFGQLPSSDQGFYDSVAQNILIGNGFTNQGKDAGIEPFYPLFLAGVYKVFGHNYDIIRIIQIILFALSVVFIYLLVYEIADWRGLDADKRGIIKNKTAFWSALAVSLFYGIANQAGSLTTETLFIFLLIIFVWAIYPPPLIKGGGWFAFAGATLGLAALTRSIIQYFFIFAVINIYFNERRLARIKTDQHRNYQRESANNPRKSALVKAGVFLVSFFIVLAPWLIREYSIGGSSVEVAPRMGGGLASRVERMEKIYPDYTGHLIGRLFGYYFSEKLGFSARYEDYRHVTETDKKLIELLKSGKTETEIDQILGTEAKKTILKEPYKYVLISFLDFISFNSPIIPQEFRQNTLEIHPMFAERRHPEIPDWEKTIIILSIRFIWFIFLFFVIYAIVKNWRKWDKIGWIVLIIIYFNLAYSAIHAIPRYALPIYPFYIMLSIMGLMKFYEKIKS